MTTLADLVQQPIPKDEQSDRQSVRVQAKAQFDHLGFPTSKWENWKYVDIDSLLSQSIGGFKPSTVTVTGYDVGSSMSDLALGCDTSPFSYLNTAYFTDSTDLIIDQTVDQPIVIEYQPSQWCYSRFNIRVAKGVSATIFLRSLPEQVGFENRFIDIALAEHASLSLIQSDVGIGGHQLSSLMVSLQESSQFDTNAYVNGLLLGRRDTQVDFYGENATAALRGVGLHRDQQQYFNHLTINHHVGNCNCEQQFKTILTDKAIAEFSGLVFVEKKAHGTDSSQLNETLLLSDYARALSRPQLRIDADDVECAHGATVGQLNPEEIFYVRSRGLTEYAAKQMLTYGFAESVLNHIDDSAIKKQLLIALKKEVQGYVQD